MDIGADSGTSIGTNQFKKNKIPLRSSGEIPFSILLNLRLFYFESRGRGSAMLRFSKRHLQREARMKECGPLTSSASALANNYGAENIYQ